MGSVRAGTAEGDGNDDGGKRKRKLIHFDTVYSATRGGWWFNHHAARSGNGVINSLASHRYRLVPHLGLWSADIFPVDWRASDGW